MRLFVGIGFSILAILAFTLELFLDSVSVLVLMSFGIVIRFSIDIIF
jgi:hypothetical protein